MLKFNKITPNSAFMVLNKTKLKCRPAGQTLLMSPIQQCQFSEKWKKRINYTRQQVLINGNGRSGVGERTRPRWIDANDSVMRVRSFSRKRNINTLVTVTVTTRVPTNTSSLLVRSRLRMSSSSSRTFSISCRSFFTLIKSDHTGGVSLPPLL